MRLLFLIHAYPPQHIGGHEIRCQRTAEGLRQRGHEVLVLTTYRQKNGPRKEGPIWRLLRSKWSENPKRSAFKWLFVYRHNIKVFQETITEFQPEVIYRWWLNWCTAAFVNYVHENAPCPVVVSVGGALPATPDDLWFHFCRTPAKGILRNLVKRTLVRLAGLWIPTRPREIVYETAVFPSRSVRDRCLNLEGWKVKYPVVIYSGVDMTKFSSRDPNAYRHPPRFLFAARMDPEKDPLTFLKAVKRLAQKGLPVRATLAGATSVDPTESYARTVLRYAESLNGIVRVRRNVPPEKMPDLFHDHEVFVFISSWEGLSLALLEAMACGLAIIATSDCGGPDEFLLEGENSLLFPFGDADALAERMEQLIREPHLVAKLGQNAQYLARQRFTFDRYLDEIERLLESVRRKVIDDACAEGGLG